MSAVATAPVGSPEWVEEHGLSAVDASRLAQLHAAEHDPAVFSFEGDLGDFGGFPFRDRFPDRYFDMGIAEANLVGSAAGLTMRGKTVFLNTFGSFALMRACEQVRLEVAYHYSDVKIVGTFTGIVSGASGPTHHCAEDLSIARTLPNMTVLAPADAVAAYHLTTAAAQQYGPMYIRLGVEATPQVYDDTAEFSLGGGTLLRDGHDLTIAAAGLTSVATAKESAEVLASQGISARVIDLYSLKPVDEELLVQSAAKTGLIVTLEEHSTLGGLGSTVAEVLGAHRPTPLRMLGLPDRFAHEVCTYQEHLHRCGLDIDGVVAAADESLRRWKP